MHDHSRSNRQWGYWEICQDHPVRPRILGVHPQNDAVFIGNVLEDYQHPFGGEVNLLLWLLIPFHSQLKSRFLQLWLKMTTPTTTLEGRLISCYFQTMPTLLRIVHLKAQLQSQITYTHTHIHTYTHTHTHTHTHIHTHTHTCIHTYIHTYMHTYIISITYM